MGWHHWTNCERDLLWRADSSHFGRYSWRRALLRLSSESNTRNVPFNPILGFPDNFPIDITDPEKLETIKRITREYMEHGAARAKEEAHTCLKPFSGQTRAPELVSAVEECVFEMESFCHHSGETWLFGTMRLGSRLENRQYARHSGSNGVHGICSRICCKVARHTYNLISQDNNSLLDSCDHH